MTQENQTSFKNILQGRIDALQTSYDTWIKKADGEPEISSKELCIGIAAQILDSITEMKYARDQFDLFCQDERPDMKVCVDALQNHHQSLANILEAAKTRSLITVSEVIGEETNKLTASMVAIQKQFQ